MKLFCLAVSALLLGATALPASAGESDAWGGEWDPRMHNLIEHPRTVALRISVVDAQTEMEVENAIVTVTGTYRTPANTSRDDGPAVGVREHEYELRMRTGDRGVAVAALGWTKDVPWKSGLDDVEKVETILVRHRDYRPRRVKVPFTRFLQVGQKSGASAQEPEIWKRFEAAWSAEGQRTDVKYCVMDMGEGFADLNDRKALTEDARFFRAVEKKQWGDLYTKPQNMLRADPRTICGPYFIYVIEVQLDRVDSEAKDKPGRDSNPRPADPAPGTRPAPAPKPAPLPAPEPEPKVAPQPAPAPKRPAMPSDSTWRTDFLSSLDFGMSGDDVVAELKKNGYSLRVLTESKSFETGAAMHLTEVSGSPLYFKKRVHQIRASFAGAKLMSLLFSSVEEREADAFFNEVCRRLGDGIQSSWMDSDVADGKKCHKRIWYTDRARIESSVNYSYDSRQRRQVRTSSLSITDWRVSDREYGRSHAAEYEQFRRLRTK